MSEIKGNFHDNFMRAMMSDKNTACDYFEYNLPEDIRKHIDLKTLAIEPDSFISDNLHERIADVLYSVDYVISEKRQKGFLYIVMEHASKPLPFMPLKMLEYQVKIWNQHIKQNKSSKTLPPVNCHVIYNGKHKYNHTLDFFELFGENKDIAKKTTVQPLGITDLTYASDNELLKYKKFKLAALTAKHIRDKNMLDHIEKTLIVEMVKTAESGEVWKILLAISYIWKAGNILDYNKLNKLVEKSFDEKTKEEIMTYADHLRQEGHQTGIQEGIQKGIEQGLERGVKKGKREKEIQMVRNMLSAELPIETISKVSGWSMKDIKNLMH